MEELVLEIGTIHSAKSFGANFQAKEFSFELCGLRSNNLVLSPLTSFSADVIVFGGGGGGGYCVKKTVSENFPTRNISRRRIPTYLWGRITVRLTSCLFCLDSAVLHEQHFLLVWSCKAVKQEVSCTVILPLW